MLISGPQNQEIKETVDHLPTGIGSQIMIKYYQQYSRYLEGKVEETADQLDLLLEALEGGTFTYHVEGDYLNWDERCRRIFGISEENFSDDFSSWLKMIHPRDREEFQQKIVNLNQQKDARRFYASYRIRRNDTQVRFIYTRGRVVRDARGRTKAIHGIHMDITDKRIIDQALIESYQNYRNLAVIDSLTGIYNRRHFLRRLGEELKRCKRYQYAFSFLMIDIDHFKEINDNYGHDTGDQVIQMMAQEIQKILRKSDIFGRFGGDEFGIVLVQTDGRLGLELARRLSRKISEIKIPLPREEIGFTISIGLTCCRGGDRNIDQIMKEADNYLYVAKKAGRNRIAWKKDKN